MHGCSTRPLESFTDIVMQYYEISWKWLFRINRTYLRYEWSKLIHCNGRRIVGGGGERERGGASSAILNYTRETTNKWLKTIWQVLDYVELCRIRACIYQTLTNWMGEAFHVQKLITKYRNIFLSNGLHAMLCTKRT